MTDTKSLRSRKWFDNLDDPEMTALYIERYLNYGLTLEELRSGKPVIGIAQTGSDLSPCNRHHIELAKRTRDGIIAAGGIPMEIPVHPIQETGKRPTAMLDRNLAYLSLVESLYGYPIDGVVLTIGCDKTTPALLMAAATVGMPALAFSVGPMLNGWHRGERAGSGSVIWQARQELAAGTIDAEEFLEIAASSAPSVGFCNTMGTASTMNSLSEALGMQLPGVASIPAPYRERGQAAYHTGKRIVDMVHADLRPAQIMTREAFENAIVVNSALGGSTNAPIHLNAIAAHLGIALSNGDWEEFGHAVPLLVNMQPVGTYLGEDFHRAGGTAAVIGELLRAGLLPHPDALTVTGQTIAELYTDTPILDEDVIRRAASPLKPNAGFLNMRGNLFDSALMKTSAIDAGFRARYFSNAQEAFEGRVAVFDGPEDFHARIDDPALGLTDDSVLVMRGAGPKGYPGGAEVVNMRPPSYLIKQGVRALPCIGDGRQSGTSGSASILNASPEAADGGGLALLQDGDPIRIDLKQRRVDVLLDETELAARRAALDAAGGYAQPESQSPWQEIFREKVRPFSEGMVFEGATEYRDITSRGLPRNNH
ncbi:MULTISPECIES: IlvD/Edd family dehydratase [Sulfitobacter]|jgi:dihydroxy-acid dehydratase|uniref:L-arabonate dehydratase n=1 Tax=Sulfitobacter pontiacus TaxID=60137 RepID=A0AAX3A7N7_9RHOB|nr:MULTISPECIES: IlvD/Edd family dehydratase [Sulfitobacter]MAX77412.1 dihydroxy-acid dehydratase [Roseobacter sp.]AXI49541.1 dihydroxy-acid dehydratase [Sulfitobacter sp. SK025]EAP82302.1 dihydroxy-acid dehydratase [Sulfitobacter sp. NAS-14.1]EAP85510.1 dihydroxy-acid dehydratase [Sulfitobacter sp. EE-36]PTB00299.1 dihydroxy-acid dehydratase [Sulfitobacter sp. CB-A]